MCKKKITLLILWCFWKYLSSHNPLSFKENLNSWMVLFFSCLFWTLFLPCAYSLGGSEHSHGLIIIFADDSQTTLSLIFRYICLLDVPTRESHRLLHCSATRVNSASLLKCSSKVLFSQCYLSQEMMLLSLPKAEIWSYFWLLHSFCPPPPLIPSSKIVLKTVYYYPFPLPSL